MKDRKIQVVVTNAEKYNEITDSKKKNGDKVKHEIIEIDELNKLNCIRLTPLQEKLLARKITRQEETKAEATAEVEALLNSPDLIEKLVKEVGQNVAGEEDTILTIGLNACGRLVENASKTSYNCIPNDESGAGKDYCTENTLKVFVPTENLIIRTRISPKVLNYWHNPKWEPEWTWDGKILYLKDVSDDVLNSEVMKTFTSDQTTATILIQQMACDLETKGKPCVFCTTANSTPGQEQLRRFALVPLDSSEKQTKLIKEFHAKRAVEGIKPEKNKTIIEAMKILERVKVTVPFASLLANKFPDKLITRTIFGTFIDLIKASTALHQFQRQKDEKEFVIADFKDYEYARKALKKITDRGGLIPVTKNQAKLLEVIDLELDKNKPETIVKNHLYWSIQEIEEKINFMTKRNLYINLGILSQNGFLKKAEKEVVSNSYESSDGQTRTFSRNVLAYSIQETNDFQLPSMEELQTEWLQNSDNNDNSNNNNNSNNNDNKEIKPKGVEKVRSRNQIVDVVAIVAKNCNGEIDTIQNDSDEIVVERDFVE